MKKSLFLTYLTTFSIVIILIVIGTITNQPDLSLSTNKEETSFLAHRGYSSVKLENTLEAFTEAGKANFKGIECDIYLTKDGQIVISHDENLKRMTGVDLVISKSNYDELKDIPFLDSQHQTIPRLSDYLAICKTFDKIPIIEIKETVALNHIKDIYDNIKQGEIDKFIIIAFNLEHLIALRTIDVELELHYLSRKYSPQYLNTCIQYNFYPSMNYKSLTKSLIALFHSHNLKVGAWTVDNNTIANQLISDGIDYITSNKLN